MLQALEQRFSELTEEVAEREAFLKDMQVMRWRTAAGARPCHAWLRGVPAACSRCLR